MTGLIALVVSLFTVPASAPSAARVYEEAVAAYEHNELTTVYRGFRGSADQGRATARYNFGIMSTDDYAN